MSDNVRFPHNPERTNEQNEQIRSDQEAGRVLEFVRTPTNKTNKFPGARHWLDRATERPAWAESKPEPAAADTGPTAPDHPEGWSDRLGRQVYEPVPERSGCWQETPGSAALCVWCPEPVAEGDKIACPDHRRQLDAIAMPWETADREVTA